VTQLRDSKEMCVFQSFCASSVQADEIIFSHSGRSFMRYLDPQMDDVIF
jgi:hypothetical protein